MRNYIYILFAICSVLLFSPKASGQRLAIAQASAQIVEGTSISSNTVNSLSINTSDNSTNIDLGQLMIKAGSSSSCEIVIKPATLTNNSGASLTMETAAIDFQELANKASSNNRILALSGNTSKIKGETGTYQGSYTIVLAYN